MMRVLAAILSVVFLYGCGDGRSAGGSASETESAVSGVLVRPDGAPASGAVVLLRKALSLVAAAEDSSQTDSAGKFHFTGVASGAWAVSAFTEDGQAVLHAFWVDSVDTDDAEVALGESRLAAQASYHMVVVDPSGAPAQYQWSVRGLGVSGSAVGTDSISLPSWEGTWIHFAPTNGAWPAQDQYLRPGRDTIRLTDHPTLLVEDFRAGLDAVPLGRAFGQGWWYAIPDTGYSTVGAGEMGADPFLEGGWFPDAGPEVGAGAAQAWFAVPATSWALVGFDLDLGHRCMDFSAVDSMEFWLAASPEVPVRLQLQTRTELYEDPDADHGHFEVELHPTTQWERFVVDRGQILSLAGSWLDIAGISWGQASHGVCFVNFVVNDTTRLEIGPIRIHGVGLDDL